MRKVSRGRWKVSRGKGWGEGSDKKGKERTSNIERSTSKGRGRGGEEGKRLTADDADAR